MRAGAWIVLALLVVGGCKKRSTPGIDPSLPEKAESVEARAPRAILEEAATSLDPSVRARALELLIRADGVQWAGRALYDPDSWVQRRAVDALLEIDSDEARSLLVRAVGSDQVDPFVRGTIAVGLAHVSEAGEALGNAWTEDSAPWIQPPLALGAAVHGDRAALKALKEALSGGAIPLELAFFEDIGRSGLDALVPALREGEERTEDELVLPYAAARMMLGDASADGSFRDAITGQSQEGRLEALDYLADREAGPVDALLRRARGEGPELVTWYAELALAARKADTASLEAGMLDPSWEVREWAARFTAAAWRRGLVKKARRKTARKILGAALTDRVGRVQVAALVGIGSSSLSLDELEPAIQQALADDHPRVRMEAAGVLLRTGQQETP